MNIIMKAFFRVVILGLAITFYSSSSRASFELLSAAQENNIEKVKIALEHKGDPNFYDFEFRTPLYFSVMNENIEIARLLIQAGANVDYVFEGSSYVETAAQFKKLRILQYFREEVGLPYTPMTMAILGDEVGLKHYVETTRPHVDVLNKLFLMLIYKKHVKCVSWLIDLLPTVSFQIEFEKYGVFICPLASAVSVGSIEIAKLLVDAGADVNGIVGPWHQYGYLGCINLAAETKALEMKNFLIQSGLFVDAQEIVLLRTQGKFAQDIDRIEQTMIPRIFKNTDSELAKAIKRRNRSLIAKLLFQGATLDGEHIQLAEECGYKSLAHHLAEIHFARKHKKEISILLQKSMPKAFGSFRIDISSKIMENLIGTIVTPKNSWNLQELFADNAQ